MNSRPYSVLVRRVQACFTLLCVTTVMAGAIASAGDTPDVFEIYISALRNQGANPDIMRSGNVELEAHVTTPAPSDDEIEAAVADKVASIKASIDAATDPAIRATLETALKNVPDAARAWMRNKADYKVRMKVLFKGPVPGASIRLVLEHFDPATQMWGAPTELIRRFPRGASDPDNLYWDPSANVATISPIISSAPSVEEFGRIVGNQHQKFTVSLLDGTKQGSFEFSDANIETARRELEKQVAAGTIRPFEIVKKIPYESSEALLLETRVLEKGNWVLTQRFSIDPSRGFVCPYVAWFFGNGQVAQEWSSSDYRFLPECGLWYPLSHTMTQFREGGEVTERREYRIDPETLQFNFDVSEDAFAVQLPTDAVALDARKPEQPSYRLSQPFRATLDNLNPDKWPGVTRVSTTSSMVFGAPLNSSHRSVLVLANVAAVIIAITIFWIRKKRSRAIGMVLFMALLIGCSRQPNLPLETWSAPASLDLGEVREQSEPVKVPIPISNRGSNPMTVSTSTSCGCSSIEPANLTLSPGETATVTASLSVRGRSGEFKSTARLALDGKTTVSIPIKATIIRDVWSMSSSVPLRQDDMTERLTGIATICILDNRNVNFEIEDAPPEFAWQEIQRETAGRVTTVKLAMSLPRDSSSENHNFRHLVRCRPSATVASPVELVLIPQSVGVSSSHEASKSGISPRVVALGHVRRGDTKEFHVFAEPTVIQSLNSAEMDVPGIGETRLLGRSEGASRSCAVALKIADTAPLGFFQIPCLLTNNEGESFSVNLLGSIDERRPEVE